MPTKSSPATRRKHLIDELKKTSPAVVDDLIPGADEAGRSAAVLQLLLREQVSIRQLGPILETLGDYAARTKDPMLLAEYVRQRLARAICTRYRDKDKRLYVVTLDPALEDRDRAAVEQTDRGLLRSRCRRRPSKRSARADRDEIGATRRPAERTADRAGQPADSRGGRNRLTAGAPAAAGRAELQRNHARYADRIAGDGRRVAAASPAAESIESTMQLDDVRER